MSDPEESSAPRPEPQVDELVFEYLERLETRAARASEVLEELCAAHPSRAEGLRRAAAALEGTGMLDGGGAGDFPERLGEFRLLRRLGGGGMGLVYLAVQEPVGRRVALKLIRGERLSDGAIRARFEREVEAVGRLAHPNIVPIHTFGEERGIPYFALELIEGATLEEVLRALSAREPGALRGRDLDGALADVLRGRGVELAADWTGPYARHTWVDACARITNEVAQALAHAHARGVLHRDVKPSNVMLSSDGRVRLIDFGLASLEGADRLTRSGTELGSLPYMPPEQIEGQAPSPAGDVYGLGVTLYELLTLRHPYFSQSTERTRRLILEARPQAPRSRNHELPRDVETVCLHAMDRDPRRRYASAEAFGRDLENLLARRPIEVRPVGAALRSLRWAQRRPAAAVALLLGFLLLTVGPLGWAINTSWAMRRVESERRRAESHFERAFDSIFFMLHAMGRDGLRNTPQLQAARLDAVDRALQLLVDLERERPEDERVRRELGQLQRTRGDVLVDLGRHAEAVSAYDAELGIFEALERGGALDADTAWQIAGSHNQRALCFIRMGAPSEAALYLERAVERLRADAARFPGDLRFKQGLATTLSNLGGELDSIDEVDAGREAILEAIDVYDSLLQDEPDTAEHLMGLALAHQTLADSYGQANDAEQSELHSAESVALTEMLLERDPTSRDAKERLGTSLSAWSMALADLGELDASLEAVERALLLRRELELDFPAIRRYAMDVQLTLATLAVQQVAAGDLEAAIATGEEALAGLQALVQRAPDELELRFNAALVCVNLTMAYAESGRSPEVVASSCARIEELVRPSIARDPGNVRTRTALALASYAHCLSLCRAQRVEEARAAIDQREERHLAELDASQLWHTGALWAEYALALRRSRPEGAEREGAEREASERMFTFLERCVDAGFHSLEAMRTTEAFDPFRADPRFAELEQRIANGLP